MRPAAPAWSDRGRAARSWVRPWPHGSARLLGPAVFEDDLDEVVADEVRIVMCQHVGVDVAEGAPRPVPVAVGERLQDAAFEIGPRVRHGDGVARLFGEVVAAD